MTLKQRIIDAVLDREGGYVNDPDDSGGTTNHGINEATARFYGYEGGMRDLTREYAGDLYGAMYWYAVGGDYLLMFSEAVTAEVVDTAVNAGPHQAGEFLQRSLNVMNLNGDLYPDLIVDGVVGSRTIAALAAYARERDESALVKMLNVLQGAFYIELAEHRQKDEKFIYGWFKNRIGI